MKLIASEVLQNKPATYYESQMASLKAEEIRLRQLVLDVISRWQSRIGGYEVKDRL